MKTFETYVTWKIVVEKMKTLVVFFKYFQIKIIPSDSIRYLIFYNSLLFSCKKNDRIDDRL